jgi:SAM-dependent methyltransferase
VNPPGNESLRAEEDRIRSAFARRQSGDLYSFFNAGHLFITQERERRILQMLADHGLADIARRSILEVGCGTGDWLRTLVRWGARPENITGLDLLPDRVAEARLLSPSSMRIDCGSAAELPYPDGSFDLVLQATVFTSILDRDLQRRIANEMLRVLREGGAVLWYDYHVDNPRNKDVRGVRRREIASLFPGCRLDLRRVTLAPPIARRLAPRAWLACEILARIPPLCTHTVGLIRKAGTRRNDET